MMPTAIGIVILLVTSVAAILAGMAVFTNVRPEKPDDPRIGQIYDGVEDIKGMVNQIQKSLLIMEQKTDKDTKDTRTEIKDSLDKMIMMLDKLSQEQSQ
jgi:DNA-binding ferritin-like protein